MLATGYILLYGALLTNPNPPRTEILSNKSLPVQSNVCKKPKTNGLSILNGNIIVNIPNGPFAVRWIADDGLRIASILYVI